jgi:phospholipid/cholesterol/gamma-HCH transport system ATP-binding protein
MTERDTTAAEAQASPRERRTGPVVEVKDLAKSFGAQKVLDGLSFTLNAGENLVVLGKSGTGKSVMIKCLVGLEYPDRGEVKVLGKDVKKLKYRDLNQLRKRIGF